MKLSPHFQLAEFRSHDGTAIPRRCIPGLIELAAVYLEPLREKYGPVAIVSGIRSPSHNRSVGGVPHSFHLCQPGRPGRAADIVCRRGSPREWYDFLDRLHPGGLGLYPSWVHVDTRSDRARW